MEGLVTAIPLGGAREIGASCLWIEAADLGVVVDFGARPGVSGPEAYPDIDRIIGAGVRPAAMVVTHAHHDHIGGLPIFHRNFPGVPVFMTQPSVRIAHTLLNDSLHIMETDADRSPDYSGEEVQSLFRTVVPVGMNEPRVIGSSARTTVIARFIRAGHILGASVVVLDFVDHVARKVARVVVSGDVSTFDQPTIRGLDLESIHHLNPDLLVLEGTNGPSELPDHTVEQARFVRQVAEAVREGGRVVIPAFAVGRAQNVAILLRRAMEDPAPFRKALGDPTFVFPKTPVYVDGMCRTVADTYDSFRSMLAPELRQERRVERHVFWDDQHIVRRVSSASERERIADSEGPWIVISSSGMLIGGAVVGYVKAIADDPKACVFLVGYQDEESPGAVLQKFEKRRPGQAVPLHIGGEEIRFRAQAHRYRLSGHSDARDLEVICREIVPESVRLVHGEPKSLSGLRDRLQGYLKSHHMRSDVGVAAIGDPIAVDGLPLRDRPEVLAALAHPSLTTRWQTPYLTGLLAGDGTVAPSAWTMAMNARLKHGGGIGVTPLEAARLDALVSDADRLSAVDIDRTQSSLHQDPSFAWKRTRSDRGGWVFSPAPVRAHRKPHSKTRRESEGTLPITSAPDSWTEGDLVIVERDYRLEPFVVLERSNKAVRGLGPSGRTEVPAHRVLSRAGSWPFPGGGDDLRDIEFIRRMADLLASHEAERWADEPYGVNPQRELDAVWDMVASGRIGMEEATIATELLAMPEIFTGMSLLSICEAFGMTDGPTDEFIDTLDALADAGFLHFEQSGVDTQVFWGTEERTVLVHAAERLDTLFGPGLGAMIRRAYDEAMHRRRLEAMERSLEAADVRAQPEAQEAATNRGPPRRSRGAA